MVQEEDKSDLGAYLYLNVQKTPMVYGDSRTVYLMLDFPR